MGVSTDAILFWGYCFEDEDEYPWNVGKESDGEEEFDPEERYAIAVGIEPPAAEYDDKNEKVKAEYQRFWEAKQKAAKKSGCTIGYHCSADCSMYYVAIEKSETTANRGYPKEINDLDVGADWHAKLTDYCEKMGIKTKQKPKWWLVSYWG